MNQATMVRTGERLAQEELVILSALAAADDETMDAASAAAATGLPKGLCALALDLLGDRGLVARDPNAIDAHPARAVFHLR